jgi:hypothetical protein
MLTALVHFVIIAVVIAVVCYVLILLWDWLCSQMPVPAPLGQIVRVIIVVICVIAVLYQLLPLVGRL